MRLTQIKLSGFKSFADSTSIHVPGQLVAVVGPNGCGKSNVIDAVRWVLGESSAKQLRGESMQDVIFNGANSRKIMSRASVELFFDNSDHALQGAWGQYSEVSIKRTLTRSGESHYYINNQLVRRRDITDLFLGTGVGVRGYAVIEQGMISRIIEAKPEELRAYIEEAAGASKYKERKRETQNRLKDTHEHLQRLNDLQGEIARQIEKLTQQAKTAGRYQQIKQDLAGQQDVLDYLLWQQATEKVADLSQQQSEVQTVLEQLNLEHSQYNEQLYQSQQTEYELQQSIQDKNQQRSLIREQSARLEEQIRHRQNLLERQKKEQLLNTNELEQCISNMHILAQEILDLEQTLEEQQFILSEYELQQEESSNYAFELNTQVESNEADYSQCLHELNQSRQQVALLEQSWQQQQRQQQQLESQLSRSFSTECSIDEDEVTLLLEESQLLSEQLAENMIAIEELESQLISTQDHTQTIEQSLKRLDAHYIESKTQLSLLEKWHQQQDKNQFWQALQQEDAPILWKQIEVADKWSHALSVFLNSKLYARINPQLRLPEVLPKGSAIWINQTIDYLAKSNDDALLNKIEIKQFQSVLNFWLEGVLCADNLDDAINQQSQLKQQQCWLTPEGHIVDRLSVHLANDDTEQSLLQGQNQITRLKADLNQLEKEKSTIEEELHLAKHEINLLTGQISEKRQWAKELQSKKQVSQDNCFKLNQQFQQQQFELQQRSEQQQRNQQQLATIKQEIKQITASLAQLSQQLTQQESHFAEIEKQRNEFKISLSAQQASRLQQERQYNQYKIQIHTLQERLQQFLQRQQNLILQKQQLEVKQQTFVWDDEDNSEQQQQKYEDLLKADKEQSELLWQLQEQLKQVKSLQQTIHQQSNELGQKLPQWQAKLQQLLLSIQETELTAKHHWEHLQKRSISIADLQESLLINADVNDITAQIARLAQQLNNMGAVNLAALEELEQTQTRQQYYQEQREDVETAMQLLQEAIQQIDHECKQLFKNTFDAVNKNMQKYFPTLFGGGEAALHVTDDDWLNTGITIMARPPGKKNSTIHLLSGGEKALTAMSLVFSLFSLNPAPFCLLDEVDAPLDDANTARFCQLVREMSQETQFLYISHNRLTMEMAEQLIGVTQQEKGVSRIVAVDVKSALELAEST